MAGAAWASTEWLAQLILAAIYEHLGWGGVILLAAVCVALALAVLTHFLLRRLEPLPALIAAIAAAALLQPHALARPHVLAVPLTPFGIAGLAQPIRLMQMTALQHNFAEWLSPDFQKSPALEMWILGLLLIGFAGRVRLPWTRLLLLLGLVHMSLQHVRHAD